MHGAQRAGDSVHAADAVQLTAQLARGFRRLRFEPPLEDQFQRYFAGINRRRAHVALIVGIALMIVYSAINYPNMRALGLEQHALMNLGLFLLILCTALALSFGGWGQRHLAELGMVCGLVTGLYRSIVHGVATSAGTLLPYEGYLLLIVAMFLLFGLSFYRALFVVVVLWAAFVAQLLIAPTPPRDLALRLFFVSAFALVGAIAAYMIEHVLRSNFLYHRLALHYADNDALTGLPNRRKFNHDIERMWHQARDEKRPVAACLIDFDHFKSYNDTYGHLQGDVALARVAAVLRDHADGPLDACARFGGEEFVLLWYGVTPEQALERAERVLAAVRALVIAHRGAARGHVTVSAGIALAELDQVHGPQDLLRRADAALYRAKHEGRDRALLEA